MVHILDSLARLELKFDDLASHGSPLASNPFARTPTNPPLVQPFQNTPRIEDEPNGEYVPRTVDLHQDLTDSHKVFLWPRVNALIASTSMQAASDVRYISQLGTPWLVELEMAKHPLALACGPGPPRSVSDFCSDNGESTFPSLTVSQIKGYADAYFDTFGVLYPILDQDVFMKKVITGRLQVWGSERRYSAHSVCVRTNVG